MNQVDSLSSSFSWELVFGTENQVVVCIVTIQCKLEDVGWPFSLGEQEIWRKPVCREMELITHREKLRHYVEEEHCLGFRRLSRICETWHLSKSVRHLFILKIYLPLTFVFIYQLGLVSVAS